MEYHYKTLKSLVNMFPTIVEVLKVVEKDDRDWKNRDQASNLLVYFRSLDCVFYLHLNHRFLIISFATQGSRRCGYHWMCEINKTPFG
jgi:hypothetical protein